MHEHDAHEDVELGELENDAFLPREDTSKPIFKQQSILTRWMQPRIRNFVHNVSKIWVRCHYKSQIPSRSLLVTWDAARFRRPHLVRSRAVVLSVYEFKRGDVG